MNIEDCFGQLGTGPVPVVVGKKYGKRFNLKG
jgi:hypothetical protein